MVPNRRNEIVTIALLCAMCVCSQTRVDAGTAQDAIKKAKEELSKQLKKKGDSTKPQQASGETRNSQADEAEAQHSTILPLTRGANKLFEMEFGMSEEESFPPELIPLRGNMIVRNFDGERYLACGEQFAFVIPLKDQISGAYAIELEVFHDLKTAMRPGLSPSEQRGLTISMAKELPTSDKWFHYDPTNAAKLSTISAELRFRDGEDSDYTKGTIEIVAESRKICEEAIARPISFFLRSDGFNTVAGWDGMSLVVQASAQTRFDSLSRFVIIQSYSALWIKYISVTSMSIEQREAAKLSYFPQQGSAPLVHGGKGGVLYEEQFEESPVGTFPVRRDLICRGGCGWVVEGPGSRMLSGPSQLFINLEKPLPEQYSLEFDLLFQGSVSSGLKAEFKAWPLFSDSLRKLFEHAPSRMSPELRCHPLSVIVGPNGSKLGESVSARENTGIEIDAATHFSLLVDGKKVQLLKDGKVVASSIEGCNFGRDSFELRFSGSPNAPVLIDNIVLKQLDAAKSR